MKIFTNPIAASIPKYEITREDFNKIMKIKKTTDRYDIHGSKRVKVSKNKSKVTTYGRHTPTRIKSEFIEGPYALVCLLTKPDKDPESPDSYTHVATIVFNESESTRVYRDSLNDGFTEAYFCDDTIMLIAVLDKNSGEKSYSYLQITGEPTGYASWKFEADDDLNKHNKDVIQKYASQAQEKTGLPEDKIFVVIQLDV